MDVLISKISAVFVLAGFTMLAGILPIRLRQSLSQSGKRRGDDGHSHGPHNKWLNVILAFSGGVLFSTIFIHLMPDVDVEFNNILHPIGDGLVAANKVESNATASSISARLMDKMPWGQLAICVGFFIIYALEEIVEHFVCLACEKQHHHHNESHSVEYQNHKQQSGVTSPNSFPTAAKPVIKIHSNPDSQCWSPIHGTHGAHREQHQLRDCTEVRRSLFPTKSDLLEDVDLEANEKTPLFKFHENGRSYKSNSDFSQEVITDKSTCDSNLSSSQGLAPKIIENDTHSHHHHNLSHSFEHDHKHNDNMKSSHEQNAYDDVRNNMRGVMLIIALSFHSVFEGMAIGLQSTFSGILSSFIAVSLHKLIMAFCAGVELLALGSKRSVFICSMIAFALICPIGIAIGTIITEMNDAGGSQENSPSLAIASLQGLACGTLLYVTFFEVLTRTKGNEMASLINFLSVLLGFVVITATHLID